MEIKIGIYTLKSDRFTAWVEQDFKITEGKAKGTIVQRRATGYYRDFGKLLDDFIEQAVKDKDSESVEEVLKSIDKALKDAKRIAREAVKADFKIVRREE